MKKRILMVLGIFFGPIFAVELVIAMMVWNESQTPPLDPQFEGALIRSNLTAIESSNIRLLIITGAGKNSEDAAVDARQKIEAAINSGEYNIATVETVYSVFGDLKFGVIAYYPDRLGIGNNLRVDFIGGGNFPESWMSRVKRAETQLKTKLKQIESAGNYSIVRIRPEIQNGHLYGAEIYYTIASKKPASFITS